MNEDPQFVRAHEDPMLSAALATLPDVQPRGYFGPSGRASPKDKHPA